MPEYVNESIISYSIIVIKITDQVKFILITGFSEKILKFEFSFRPLASWRKKWKKVNDKIERSRKKIGNEFA
jgi:hypothetical protein